MEEIPECFDLRHTDEGFKDEIICAAGGETLTRCFGCGICTGCCPVSEIDSRFRPSFIIQKILLGRRQEVLQSPEIWYCLQCFSCSFHCPQGVKFADIIRVLRHMAVAEGYVPPEMMERLESLELIVRRTRNSVLDQFFEMYQESGKGPKNMEKLWKGILEENPDEH